MDLLTCEAHAWVDASESVSWWMMRLLGVRDNFIQDGGHTFIYAVLCVICVTKSFDFSLLLVLNSKLKKNLNVMLSRLHCVYMIVHLLIVP